VTGEGVHDVPATGAVVGAFDDGLFVLVDDRDVKDLFIDVVRVLYVVGVYVTHAGLLDEKE
jgi:hypothetical protein